MLIELVVHNFLRLHDEHYNMIKKIKEINGESISKIF